MIRIEVQNGALVRMVNRLSGDAISLEAPPPLTGIRHLEDGELWNDGAQVYQQTSGKEVATELRWEGQSGLHRLTTRWQTTGEGDIVITQRAECAQGGLIGMQWGLAIPQGWELLLPVMSGFRLTPEMEFEPLRLEYPYPWEAQFVLIQGKRGGFLVYAEDDMQHFKRLFVQRGPGQLWVGLETWCHAPFASIRQADSVRWCIRAYRGNWLHGAAMYRQWAEERFELARYRLLQPDWVQEIQTVVIDNLDDRDRLEALAQRFHPKQTLLYVPAWRLRGYDRYYPDYTPRDGFVEELEHAKQRGFRVMLHVNYFGCHPEHPDYEQLRPYHHLEPFTGAPLYWDWRGQDPPVKFAYINPAARLWRDLFVERMVELCQKLRPDALHLDQTAVIINDGRGLVDGMNAMQGNLALHRALADLLPGVALSGEGLSEVTFRCESFAQRHVWGLDSVAARLVPQHIDAAHPVSSALFTPHTRLYGYLGMINPFGWRLYSAWRIAYDRFGVIPTFAWLEKEQLLHPDGTMRALLREAEWFALHRPQPHFSPGDWRRGTLFLYLTQEARLARYYRDANGVCLQKRTDRGWTVVARRIEGVTRTRVGGHIPGWLAYRGREIFGLNPSASYPWRPEPPDKDALHVLHLSDNIRIGSVSTAAGEWACFGFEPEASVAGAEVEVFSPSPVLHAYLDGVGIEFEREGASRYRFTLPGRRCQLVLVLASSAILTVPASLKVEDYPVQIEADRLVGQPVEYQHGMLPTVTPEGKARLGLFAHPLQDGRLFHAVLVHLPEHATRLRGVAGSLLAQTPLRLSVEVNGKEMWNQTVASAGEQAPFEIPLNQWKGQPALLRFIAQAPANYHLTVAQWGEVSLE